MTRRTLSALPVTRCLHHRCGRLTGSGAAGACRLHKRAVSDLYRNVRYCCRVCGFDGARFRSIVLESVERLYDPPHIEHQSRLLLISVLGFMVNMVMIPTTVCQLIGLQVGIYFFHEFHAHPDHSACSHSHGGPIPSCRALSMLVTEPNCCRRWCEWMWRQF